MKLSFVIPAYNEEAYIGKCLDSIFRELKGKNYDCEIIVVNNASTDKTKKIALSYKGVKVVDEPKKGLVNARKAGFLAATGDLIANVDADNILTPGWIDLIFKEFTKHEKLVALSGPNVFYDLSKGINWFIRLFYAYAFMAYLINRYIFRKGSMLQGGNFVFKKAALDMVGFNVKYQFWGEDADLARRLHKVGQVKYTFLLQMYSSGRRIATEGPMTMSTKYVGNYLWTFLFKKPLSKDVMDIRYDQNVEKLKCKPISKKKEYASSLFVLFLMIFFPLAAIVLLYYLFLITSQKSSKAIYIKNGTAKIARKIDGKLDNFFDFFSLS